MSTTPKKSVTLSNGQKLDVFSYKGKDMINASRIAKGDTMAMSFALIASRIHVDGKPQTYDDMLEMDGDLLTEILEHVNGEKAENFPSEPAN